MEKITTRKFVCSHLRTTIIDDKRYCVDCREGIIIEEKELNAQARIGMN